ncbi:hypothetical protein CUJ83_03860 [Methanocella sp. CWC-04]|uniref:Double zinc ribbon n=1 Tax=Methanooceanicella nereidis TaxID=2052831 RepID=A0AAP2RB83_9EURY|nr:zinc ribbon domain-containing protein [Methanocella sp. CWC-04]MCD1294128.1 hypothetical protein [Methanocella sp. CWC-04]
MPEGTIYCGNCREELSIAAKACPKCGCDPRKVVNYCTNCGEPKSSEAAIICTKCGAQLSRSGSYSSGSKGSSEMTPEMAAIISLLIPGLGLFLIYPEDKKQTGILITLGLIFADIVTFIAGLILVWFLVGLCCFFFVPVIHIGAAVYTYNEAQKLAGGKPLF